MTVAAVHPTHDAACPALDFRAVACDQCGHPILPAEAAMPIRSLRSIVAGQTPITVPRTATVIDAARMMKEHNIGALLVVNGPRLSGIFTERDALFRVLAMGRDPGSTLVADVMTAQPQTIHPDEPFLHALRM